MNTTLGTGNIHPDIDLTFYHSFIKSESFDIKKDKVFAEKLQEHLANIGKYKIVLQRLNLYYAGQIQNQGLEKGKNLENELKKAIGSMDKELDACILEIDKLID